MKKMLFLVVLGVSCSAACIADEIKSGGSTSYPMPARVATPIAPPVTVLYTPPVSWAVSGGVAGDPTIYSPAACADACPAPSTATFITPCGVHTRVYYPDCNSGAQVIYSGQRQARRQGYAYALPR